MSVQEIECLRPWKQTENNLRKKKATLTFVTKIKSVVLGVEHGLQTTLLLYTNSLNQHRCQMLNVQDLGKPVRNHSYIIKKWWRNGNKMKFLSCVRGQRNCETTTNNSYVSELTFWSGLCSAVPLFLSHSFPDFPVPVRPHDPSIIPRWRGMQTQVRQRLGDILRCCPTPNLAIHFFIHEASHCYRVIQLFLPDFCFDLSNTFVTMDLFCLLHMAAALFVNTTTPFFHDSFTFAQVAGVMPSHMDWHFFQRPDSVRQRLFWPDL